MRIRLQKPNSPARAILMLLLSIASIADAQTLAANSKLAEGSWYKIPISKTGVYKLTTSSLSDLSGIPCNQIALYGMPGGQLSTTTGADLMDDLVPVALEVTVENNGTATANGVTINLVSSSTLLTLPVSTINISSMAAGSQ